MQKNWYAVYTKPHYERKVSLSLARKNIDNICPLNFRKSRQLFRSFTSGDPVFNCYVFVRSTESEIIPLIKQISGAISLLYWKGKPATIKDAEILSIKEFSLNHQEIKIEKMNANSLSEESDTSYLMDGQILFVKNRTMRLNIPSLGLTMVAKLPEEKLHEESLLTNTRTFGNKELFLPS